MKDGVINILKPPGMTSCDVVSDIRHILHIKRVGHTGTLDPGAAGVLPVCLGRATKLFDYLLEKEKEYIAQLTFGTTTDTLDSYGKAVATCDKKISLSELRAVIPSFVGDIEQTAPMYSAVSVGGERLYKLARRGEVIERAKRRVHIYGIDIISFDGTEADVTAALISVRCTKGTYIRTLCSDIGERLGTLAYMSFLLRTASGRFTTADAITISELRAAAENGSAECYIMPTDVVLSEFPEMRYAASDATARKKLTNGCSYDCSSDCVGKIIRVYIGDEFIGIGAAENGTIRIKTHFSEVTEQ